ncbi:ankyrin [Aureobasidium namibiae CBS 147.97]|uniref:Ankyrin n=1 Tax=Aureobasidium namibiae CBS 147.97 TaxID=1043004 RepID=A0A074X065_9PEZI|nr:ankyrin [Aureobasidium namibiae CBS 147.97]KEQ75447.1 ankyrin [Aureobasidium namibiae CBS 147.97]
MLIKTSFDDETVVLPDTPPPPPPLPVESQSEAPALVEIWIYDDPNEALMLVERHPPNRSVAPPPPPPLDEAPMLEDIWLHDDPDEAPMLVEWHPPDGSVAPPPPPPFGAPMLEEIWLYDEPVPPPPVEPRDESPVVILHGVPVDPPHVESPDEAQDFDAIVSALASRHLGEVQLTFSWWRMHHDTEYSRNRLTGHLTEGIEHEDIDILDYLLQQGVPFTLRQIEPAIRKKSISMLDMFLRHGWDINEPESWSTPPLLRRALSNEDLIMYFLRNGADPNARCAILDITPLSYALVSASLSTIQLLFDHGGSVHCGQLLHYAAMRESEDRLRVYEILLQKGSRSRLNTLLYADDQKSMNMMCDTPRGTPLHRAAQQGYVDVVKFLLESGCDPAIRDTRGETALDWAEYYGHCTVMEVLQRVTPLQD